MRREKNPDYKGDEEFNYIMSVIFPDNQLHIMDYNRLVKDLNGNSKSSSCNWCKTSLRLKKKAPGFTILRRRIRLACI